MNGLNLGGLIHSVKNIIHHISNKINEQLIHRTMKLNSKLSALIEESISNKTTLLFYS